MRLLAPDGAVAQTDVAGRRYTASRGGIYEVNSAAAASAMRAEGFTTASATHGPATRGGFNCPSCGFKSFVLICSRCQSTCIREASS